MCGLDWDDEGGIVANAVVQPRCADPETGFVDFDGLDWGEFPTLAEWTDDRRRDAFFDRCAALLPGDPHAGFPLARVDFR